MPVLQTYASSLLSSPHLTLPLWLIPCSLPGGLNSTWMSSLLSPDWATELTFSQTPDTHTLTVSNQNALLPDVCLTNTFRPLFMCCTVLCRSVVSDSATPWTAAHQAPLAMGILQARTLEWVAMPFSRGSSQPRSWTGVSCIVGGFFLFFS